MQFYMEADEETFFNCGREIEEIDPLDCQFTPVPLFDKYVMVCRQLVKRDSP